MKGAIIMYGRLDFEKVEIYKTEIKDYETEKT